MSTTENSTVFSVVEGNDTSCLAAYASLSSSSISFTSTPPTSTATPATAATNTSNAHGLSAGAIAGVAIGALAILACFGLLLFVCLRRRRTRRNLNSLRGPEMSQTLGLGGVSGRGHRQIPSASTTLGRTIPLSNLSPFVDRISDDGEDEEKFNRNGSVDTLEESPVSSDQQNTARSSLSGQNPFGTSLNTPRTLHEYDTADLSPSDARSASNFAGPSSYNAVRTGIDRFGSNKASLSRTTSLKRKPVPSMGPQLRNEIEQQRSEPETRKSFQLVPDLPVQNNK